MNQTTSPDTLSEQTSPASEANVAPVKPKRNRKPSTPKPAPRVEKTKKDVEAIKSKVQKEGAKKAEPKMFHGREINNSGKVSAIRPTSPKKSKPETMKAAPKKKVTAPVVKKKGKVGGARPGSGRKTEIKDKKRQTIDFEGAQKKQLIAIAKKLKLSGISPLIRLILDEYLPAIVKNPDILSK